MTQKLLWVAAAGAAGTLARWGLSVAVQQGRDGFPWGTLAVNAIGCFLFGLVFEAAAARTLAIEIRLVVLTGFMGAFTTFSTFGFETAVFVREGRWLMAGGNLLAQNVLGIALVFAGMGLARAIGGAQAS